MSGKKALGGDWYEYKHKDGRPYYYNRATKKTQWKWPAEIPRIPIGGAAAPPIAPKVRIEGGPPSSRQRVKEAALAGGDTSGIAATKGPGGSNPAAAASSKAIRELGAFAAKQTQRAPDAKQVEKLLRKARGDGDEARANLSRFRSMYNPMQKVEGWRKFDHVFRDFALEHFHVAKGGVFSKAEVLDDLIVWSKDGTLKKPLLDRAGRVKNDAVQMMRNISGFMGDRKSSKAPLPHVQKMIRNAMAIVDGDEDVVKGLRVPALWDEIYAQIVKQTTRNPNPASLAKGMQLMDVCAGVFPCSDDIYPYLMAHCNRVADVSPPLRMRADHIMYRLHHVKKLKLRKELPLDMEVAAVLNMHPVMVRVFTLEPEDVNKDGINENASVVVPVESWTTAEQLAKLTAALLGVRDPAPFALYEYLPGAGQNTASQVTVPVDDRERVLDLVAHWSREMEDDVKRGRNTEAIKAGHFKSRLVYRVKYFLPISRADPAAEALTYFQAVSDVVSGRYTNRQPVRRAEVYECAVHQILSEARYRSPYADPRGIVEGGNIAKYVPAKYCDQAARDGICKLYMQMVAKGAGGSKTAGSSRDYDWRLCRRKYIKCCAKWALYGMTVYIAKPHVSCRRLGLPETVFIAVCPEDIKCVDMQSRSVLRKISYRNFVHFQVKPKVNQFMVQFQDAARGGALVLLKLELPPEELPKLYDLVKVLHRSTTSTIPVA